MTFLRKQSEILRLKCNQLDYLDEHMAMITREDIQHHIAPIDVDSDGVGIWALWSTWIDADEHTISWNVQLFDEYRWLSMFRAVTQNARMNDNSIGVDVAVNDDVSRMRVCALETNMSFDCCVHCYEYNISSTTLLHI